MTDLDQIYEPPIITKKMRSPHHIALILCRHRSTLVSRDAVLPRQIVQPEIQPVVQQRCSWAHDSGERIILLKQAQRHKARPRMDS